MRETRGAEPRGSRETSKRARWASCNDHKSHWWVDWANVCLVINMVYRLPELTVLVMPYEDLRPVEVTPEPKEAGVCDLEAGPWAGGRASEAGVGRRQQLLGAVTHIGLHVHDHGQPQPQPLLSALCSLAHFTLISPQYLQHRIIILLNYHADKPHQQLYSTPSESWLG